MDPVGRHGVKQRLGGCLLLRCDCHTTAAQWSAYWKGAYVATDLSELQGKLWEAADQLRANSGLKASEYASPVLGLIFLRYADERFTRAAESIGPGSVRRPTGPDDYKAVGGSVPAGGVPVRHPAGPARGCRHRQGRQPGHGRHRGLQPRPPGHPADGLFQHPRLTSPGSYCAQRHRQSRVRAEATPHPMSAALHK